MNQRTAVLIMAGGTGGHIFPGIAVAQELMRRGVHVAWLGSNHGLEKNLVPRAGISLHCISVSGVRGKGWLTLLTAPIRLLRSMREAWVLFRKIKPHSALAFGGFAAGPGGLVARLQGVPLIVHEQNCIPGLTNKILARFASRLLCGFPDVFGRGVLSEEVGNPVRAEMTHLQTPRQRLQERTGPLRLLVLGGSQGARALNAAVPHALRQVQNSCPIEVWHQTGEKLVHEAREHYQRQGITGRIEPFIEDMASAYGWADVVICRAGALTLAELCATGTASILVPFPAAVDDHQTHNARFLVEHRAAFLVSQTPLLGEDLAQYLEKLSRSRELLLDMAEAAYKLAKPEASQSIADICVQEAGL
jgi:UDP-N-acetylglucosamine--N-acetylmuramyl-(pentapeptide) pyrophosphoryl-undecaprenol N-acetylglucosamine transferase